jgi:peptidoglycan/LPS O-acetylase OafA/YrhL
MILVFNPIGRCHIPVNPSHPIPQNIPQNLDWLTRFKGIGILWIFLVHGIEHIFPSYLLFSNPNAHWGTLADRIHRVMPLEGYGWADFPVNAFRYISWLGDEGVQMFLIASGFGLTWSVLNRKPEHWQSFYRRRLWKLYPLWWGAHFLFLIPSLLLHQGLALDQPNFYLSLLGCRWSVESFYYFSPSWWFMGLILQLYLVFPLLLAGLKRWGALRFFLGITTIAIGVRWVGLCTLGDPYLDQWSRGIFLSPDCLSLSWG